jgi:transcriptional regulator with XRE-family HTH domain
MWITWRYSRLMPQPFGRQILRGSHNQKVALGRVVQVARQRRGWEQVELGARIGRSQDWISRLECGAVVISALEFVRLMGVLDIDMASIERIAWDDPAMPGRDGG